MKNIENLCNMIILYGLFIYIYTYKVCFRGNCYMDAKLTLKLNKNIIEKAKVYASSNKRSLSRMIESYLENLVESSNNENEIEISPFVKSLSSGVKLPSDINYKDEYGSHQEEKYK